MYEKILVPLDGSKLAEVALPYAEELAGKLGSEVILIHVSDSGSYQTDQSIQSYMQQIVEATAYNAEKHLGMLVAKRIEVSSEIIAGNPAEEIAAYADKADIDLIVLATHGRTGIERWALGSVANKIIRGSRQPVMLVRAKGDWPDVREQSVLRKILVPVDSSPESEAIMPYIEKLASRLKAELILLRVVEQTYHVYGDSQWITKIPYSEKEMEPMKARASGYLRKVEDSLKDRGITTESLVRAGHPAQEIIKLAQEINIDLVAMSTHAQTGIYRWVFGSIADKVLHAGTTPLLVVKNKKSEYARDEAIIDKTQVSLV